MEKITSDKKNVAVKYNGYQLDKHNTFAYDYMTFNYEGVLNLETLSPRITIEKQAYGSKVFQTIVKVCIDKERFCVVTADPRNVKVGVNLVQIKLENHLLYRMELNEIRLVLEWFVSQINVRLRGISRLDVCADYEDATSYFGGMIKEIIGEKVLISGREKHFKLFNDVLGCYGKTKKGKIRHTGFAIGKKSSAKYLRVYNKSIEMEQIKFKKHISEHWDSSDFENKSDVWRFEYSLNSRFMKEYDVEYKDIWDEKYILTLLETAYKNHFVLKENTNKSEINKEKTVFELIFSALDTGKKVLHKAKKELCEVIQKSIVSIKRQVKGLYRSYFSTNHVEFYDALKIHLVNYELMEWFTLKQDEYKNEFNRDALKLRHKMLELNYFKTSNL